MARQRTLRGMLEECETFLREHRARLRTLEAAMRYQGVKIKPQVRALRVELAKVESIRTEILAGRVK